jgi:hypothetical protein
MNGRYIINNIFSIQMKGKLKIIIKFLILMQFHILNSIIVEYLKRISKFE